VQDSDRDAAAWREIAPGGRERFVFLLISRTGVPLGLVLAGWNAMIGNVAATHDVARLVYETIYYFAGSCVLTGLAARLQWSYLERRFGRRDDVRSRGSRSGSRRVA
jgi:hypothetical protein